MATEVTMGKRRYSSELREQQAAATRERVVRAAAELFASRGYAATSLPQIARAAGVSTETVQGHGPKLRLLRTAIDQYAFGARSDQALIDTPLGARFLEAGSIADAARISADILVQVNGGTHGLWLAFSEAARGDAKLARELRVLAERIRAENLAILRLWRERGWLRDDVSDDVLARWSDVISSVEVYDRVVRVEGSSLDEYRDLLERLLLELLARR
ncbi:MAG: TetR family transcriptional regulator [Micropruina sp.]|uniref:TetR/AcrR family transcriptional regulator n=1 Tax=Micropruina sp. TaxID=2737536 RepID=UPI0039E4629A